MRIKERLNANKKLISNFSYMTLLEVFILLAPMITYPYLVRVLGRELYGWVITAQVTASYCTILIEFGFKLISARHIARNIGDTHKISEVLSSILILRGFLWVVSFILYMIVILAVVPYRHQMTLFLFSFLTTLSSVLFLDFYFQGTENMKYISLINIIVRGVFVAATFIIIRKPENYIYVPLLWSCGYVLGGAVSIWVVFVRHKMKFVIPCKSVLKSHLKEGSVIFTSSALLTIKDKLNYNIMGSLIGMSDIVIYDIGSKIGGLLQRPIDILKIVLFPRMSKNPSVSQSKRGLMAILLISSLLVGIVNIFMPWIVKFFINTDIDLGAVRLFSISPIILGVSTFIVVNIFYPFGKDKWILDSSYVTTIAYLVMLAMMYFAGLLTSVFAFVALTISIYFIEAIYRLSLAYKIFKENG